MGLLLALGGCLKALEGVLGVELRMPGCRSGGPDAKGRIVDGAAGVPCGLSNRARRRASKASAEALEIG